MTVWRTDMKLIQRGLLVLVMSLSALVMTACQQDASISGAEQKIATVDAVNILSSYVRAVPPGQMNSAAFMQIENGSGQAHQLAAANSEVAEVVELHTHTNVGGVMQMRQVPHIAIPPKETVVLEPGGLHVMLIGLKQNLVAGERIEVELVYGDGSRETIVMPIAEVAGGMMHKGMDHSKHH